MLTLSSRHLNMMATWSMNDSSIHNLFWFLFFIIPNKKSRQKKVFFKNEACNTFTPIKMILKRLACFEQFPRFSS